jgi:ATP-dependent Clp protease adaptor protein ClpS
MMLRRLIWRFFGWARAGTDAHLVSHVAQAPRSREGFGLEGLRSAKDPQRVGDGPPGSGTAVITRTKTQTKRPSMYRVLLLNDDYTPMEFVVSVLKKYFNKGPEEATRIMLHVHQHGVGECGVFTYEVAETKVTQVMDFARKNQHPLQCIMEKK